MTSVPAQWSAGGRLLPAQVVSSAAATRMAPLDERHLQTG